MELLRHQRLVYMNVGGVTPQYELVGQGFTGLTVAANAKTAEKQYIHQKNASGGVSGYAPTMSFTSVMDDSDEVSLYLQGIANKFEVGAKANTSIVIVDTWMDGTTAGTQRAWKQDVMVQIDNPGSSDAGVELALTGTLNYVGDVVEGEFNSQIKSFTAK